MLEVVLVIQVIVTVFLIAVIMIQKSEGGGLGIGGSGGGMGDFLGVKGTANLLTRVTAVLAGTFMVLAIVLAILYSRVNSQDTSIVDKIVQQEVVVEQVVQDDKETPPVEMEVITTESDVSDKNQEK